MPPPKPLPMSPSKPLPMPPPKRLPDPPPESLPDPPPKPPSPPLMANSWRFLPIGSNLVLLVLAAESALVPPIAFGTREGSRQLPVSVGPHHTGDTVAAMANRRDIEIVLKDLDDPNVTLYPPPPGPKSMVCCNVSVATLTSLLKPRHSLHEVDYYVFKFASDDDDFKWLKLDAESDADVKLMERFPQLPQDKQVWYCKMKTVHPTGAGKYYTPKADPDHTRKHRERLRQTRLALAPQQEEPPPRSITQYKCKGMVTIRVCLLCGDAAWNEEHENSPEHQMQLRKYELIKKRWDEACAMIYLHLLDDTLELPSWVRIDNSVSEAGGVHQRYQFRCQLCPGNKSATRGHCDGSKHQAKLRAHASYCAVPYAIPHRQDQNHGSRCRSQAEAATISPSGQSPMLPMPQIQLPMPCYPMPPRPPMLPHLMPPTMLSNPMPPVTWQPECRPNMWLPMVPVTSMMSVPPDLDLSSAFNAINVTDTPAIVPTPMSPPHGLQLEREGWDLLREETEEDATSSHAPEPQMETQPEPKGDACHDTCVVCMDKHREFAAIPCGHPCTCKECSSKLATCPMCQTALADVKWMRIYC